MYYSTVIQIKCIDNTKFIGSPESRKSFKMLFSTEIYQKRINYWFIVFASVYSKTSLLRYEKSKKMTHFKIEVKVKT